VGLRLGARKKGALDERWRVRVDRDVEMDE
jgi:hypothetical protein